MNIHPCVESVDQLDVELRALSRSTSRISDSHARCRLHQGQQLEASHRAAGEGEASEPGALTKSQL